MPAAPVVLDSHALVAYFRDEPGGEQPLRPLLLRSVVLVRPLADLVEPLGQHLQLDVVVEVLGRP